MAAQCRFRRYLSQLRRLAVSPLALCLAFHVAAAAQQPSPNPPYTFHVYEDLVQMPTLVMDPLHQAYRNLSSTQFSVRLDSGPPFHPRHARLEADDPLNLALLIDTSTPANADILRRLPADLAHLPPDWLGPNDSLSIYAVDCSLVRTIHDVRFTPTLLQSGVHDALSSPLLQPPGSAKTRCAASLRLWDSLAAVAGQLGQRPGRRAVLMLTDGHDQASRQTWNQLQLFADRFSVTLIALRPTSVHLSRDAAGWIGIDPAGEVGDHPQKSFEEILGMLCGGTGGLVLDVDPATLVPQLQRAVSLLRSRYILEFPRAANSTRGLHEITVTVSDPTAIVRTTGISFPLQDKALLNAPGTLPNDPARIPQQGSRKILTQPQ